MDAFEAATTVSANTPEGYGMSYDMQQALEEMLGKIVAAEGGQAGERTAAFLRGLSAACATAADEVEGK